MWAAVRDVGTEIQWDDCTTKEIGQGDSDTARKVIDDGGVTCNTVENEKELNCKLKKGEKGMRKY